MNEWTRLGALSRFFRTTLFGGFFVLFPLLLFVMLIGEIADVLVLVATPLADILPSTWIDRLRQPLILAVILVVAASFALGLAARIGAARGLGQWFEKRTLARLPVYRMIKGFSNRLAGVENGDHFKPVLLCDGQGLKRPALFVEKVGDEYAMVLVPIAPMAMMGDLVIAPVERIEHVAIPLSRFAGIIGQMGVGAQAAWAEGVHGPKGGQ